jgi:hypothetical protein
MQPSLTRPLPWIDAAEKYTQIRPDQVRNPEFGPSAVSEVVHVASRVRCQESPGCDPATIEVAILRTDLLTVEETLVNA